MKHAVGIVVEFQRCRSMSSTILTMVYGSAEFCFWISAVVKSLSIVWQVAMTLVKLDQLQEWFRNIYRKTEIKTANSAFDNGHVPFFVRDMSEHAIGHHAKTVLSPVMHVQLAVGLKFKAHTFSMLPSKNQ